MAVYERLDFHMIKVNIECTRLLQKERECCCSQWEFRTSELHHRPFWFWSYLSERDSVKDNFYLLKHSFQGRCEFQSLIKNPRERIRLLKPKITCIYFNNCIKTWRCFQNTIKALISPPPPSNKPRLSNKSSFRRLKFSISPTSLISPPFPFLPQQKSCKR